jgi:hypothetical protein
MIKSLSAFAIMSLLGAAVVALPAFAPAVKAEETAAFAKADRLATHSVATDCAQQVWPHIDTACLRSSGAGGRISEARLIVAPQSSASNRNR